PATLPLKRTSLAKAGRLFQTVDAPKRPDVSRENPTFRLLAPLLNRLLTQIQRILEINTLAQVDQSDDGGSAREPGHRTGLVLARSATRVFLLTTRTPRPRWSR